MVTARGYQRKPRVKKLQNRHTQERPLKTRLESACCQIWYRLAAGRPDYEWNVRRRSLIEKAGLPLEKEGKIGAYWPRSLEIKSLLAIWLDCRCWERHLEADPHPEADPVWQRRANSNERQAIHVHPTEWAQTRQSTNKWAKRASQLFGPEFDLFRSRETIPNTQ